MQLRRVNVPPSQYNLGCPHFPLPSRSLLCQSLRHGGLVLVEGIDALLLAGIVRDVELVEWVLGRFLELVEEFVFVLLLAQAGALSDDKGEKSIMSAANHPQRRFSLPAPYLLPDPGHLGILVRLERGLEPPLRVRINGTRL